MRTVDQSRPPDGLVVLASGPSVSGTIAKALELIPERAFLSGSGAIEILTPSQLTSPLAKPAIDSLVRDLERRFPGDLRTVRSETRSDRDTAWLDVPPPPGAHRFDRVRVPAWWFAASRRLLVTMLPGRVARPAQRPLHQLAALAHPRQRLAARLSRDHPGLVAELASPWVIDAVVLVGSHQTQRLVAVTRDLIAAELVWLALSGSHGYGPWEDPAIQRATALDLGISGPHQLRFIVAADFIDPSFAPRLASLLGSSLASPVRPEN